jgi:hypothetical protein
MVKPSFSPVKRHAVILAVLLMPVLLSLLFEIVKPSSMGGFIFSQYAFTRLLFFLWVLYGLFSTLIVCLVFLISKIRHKGLSKTSVVLSHVIPVLLGFMFLQLGGHDKIQNFFKRKNDSHISHTRQMITKKKRCSDLPPLNRSVFLSLAGGVSESKRQEDQSRGN